MALVAPGTAAEVAGADAPAGAPGPRLEARLAPATITVGDPVVATLDAPTPGRRGRAAEPTLPGLDERWGEAELLAPAQLARRATAKGAELVWHDSV